MIEIGAAPRARGETRWRSVEAARRRVNDAETYLIRRHGAWWRPKARGYTKDLAEAGLYDAATARFYLGVEGLSAVPLSSLRKQLTAEIADLKTRAELLQARLDQLSQAPAQGDKA